MFVIAAKFVIYVCKICLLVAAQQSSEVNLCIPTDNHRPVL